MVLLRLIVPFIYPILVAANCYWPDGAEDNPNLKVCDMSSQHSHCCYTLDACMNNGYCLNQDPNQGYGNRLVRAGCTDSTWQSDACKYIQ